MSSKVDAKLGIEKSSFRGGTTPSNLGELGGRRGVKGGGKPLPWAQEVQKQGKKRKKKGRRKDGRKR